MIEITRNIIDHIPIIESVRKNTNGAVVTFLGTTRLTSQGKKVLYLEYESYKPMAIKKLNEIVGEVTAKWDIRDIAIVHRIGHLNISDVSLTVAVSSPHRKESFEACGYIVDRIKETVPIWKKEVFEDGETWVGCQSLGHHQVSTKR